MTDYSCPTCGGPGVYMGCLGFLAWFRCRNCGMEYNINVACMDDEMEALRQEEVPA